MLLTSYADVFNSYEKIPSAPLLVGILWRSWKEAKGNQKSGYKTLMRLFYNPSFEGELLSVVVNNLSGSHQQPRKSKGWVGLWSRRSALYLRFWWCWGSPCLHMVFVVCGMC